MFSIRLITNPPILTDTSILPNTAAKNVKVHSIEMGFDKNNVHFCKTAADLHETLNPLMTNETIVLFKFPSTHP